MADVRAQSGVPVAAQFGGLSTPTMCAPLVVDSATGIIYSLKTGDVVVAAGAGGTVTSVAQTFTGGIISVAGSPITTTGTLALTVAGTSGGVPYFSSGTAWASSGALAANALVIGGGAGAAPSTVTTGANVLTALGVAVGSAGAFVTFNGAGGTPSSMTATNLTGTAAGLTAGTASAVAVGGITGLGTNVATALAVNVGSPGAFVTFNGALGTPSSGTATNLTGTAAGLTAGVATVAVALQTARALWGNNFDGTAAITGTITASTNGITVPTTAAGTCFGSSYTPTVSATTNVGASTPQVTGYARIGPFVTVAGGMNIDPTATGFVSFEIDLPVASNIGAIYDLGGSLVEEFGFTSGPIYGSVANNTALFQYISGTTGATTITFKFGYRVI